MPNKSIFLTMELRKSRYSDKHPADPKDDTPMFALWYKQPAWNAYDEYGKEGHRWGEVNSGLACRMYNREIDILAALSDWAEPGTYDEKTAKHIVGYMIDGDIIEVRVRDSGIGRRLGYFYKNALKSPEPHACPSCGYDLDTVPECKTCHHQWKGVLAGTRGPVCVEKSVVLANGTRESFYLVGTTKWQSGMLPPLCEEVGPCGKYRKRD